MAASTARQQGAVLIKGATAHGVAGQHVLAHGLFQEAFWRNDLDLASLHIVFADDAFDTAIVVGVTVGVDHRLHGFLGTVFVVKVEAGFGHFGCNQRVDNDQPIVRFDNGHVGEVETTNLIDLVGHFEQTVIQVQFCNAPQAGVHRVRRFAFDEVIGGQVPRCLTFGILDGHRHQRFDKAFFGVLKVLFIRKR